MNETEPNTTNRPVNPAARLAKMGMLVAISVVLVYLIHFPIFPAVAFLEYDPAEPRYIKVVFGQGYKIEE